MSKSHKNDELPDKDQEREIVLGAVHLSESALEQILNNGHSAVVIVDNDFKFEYVSRRAGERIFGSSVDAVIGHDFREWMSDDVAKLVGERFLKRLGGDAIPAEYPIKIFRQDGDVRTVNIRVALVNGLNGQKKTLVHVLDITEQKQYREDLEESEGRYRTLVESMNDGLAIDDNRGVLTYVNDAFYKMLGYSHEEIIGKSWIDFVHNLSADEVQSKREDRIAGNSENYELEWVTKSGAKVPTIVSATPYLDSDGEFVGTFAVITQITTQKDAEETVQFYLDLLTHDIANQLQVIITASGLIDPELPSQYIIDSRQDVLDAVERCNRLITKVKRAGELRNLPHSSVELTSVIRDKVAVLERIYGAEVIIEKMDKAIMVDADALLGELLWNLFENAARHNPKKDKDKKVWISGKKKNGMYELAIADNGPGIGDERKVTIFDKSRRSGGVGLTLVAQMARKYGGTIEILDRVKGKPSMGTKFVLHLNLVTS